MRILKWMAALLLVTASASMASGQSATGEVNGTVTDQTGAAVPGAAVKLVNQSTKIESQTTTNESGYFTFVNVKPAPYILTVEMQGFKGAQTGQFNVDVAATVTQNMSLSVGNVSETVEVISGAELIQRSS
ncbi:MAG TPA: carboxypeptidase-like regulatory domain-containing protein, partial [Pyrinomonadaceae bacterium]|nr:carboxypeptidase-like regulatory domain-containing protein [Pyrinomonadaceae bacterium]